MAGNPYLPNLNGMMGQQPQDPGGYTQSPKANNYNPQNPKSQQSQDWGNPYGSPSDSGTPTQQFQSGPTNFSNLKNMIGLNSDNIQQQTNAAYAPIQAEGQKAWNEANAPIYSGVMNTSPSTDAMDKYQRDMAAVADKGTSQFMAKNVNSTSGYGQGAAAADQFMSASPSQAMTQQLGQQYQGLNSMLAQHQSAVQAANAAAQSQWDAQNAGYAQSRQNAANYNANAQAAQAARGDTGQYNQRSRNDDQVHNIDDATYAAQHGMTLQQWIAAGRPDFEHGGQQQEGAATPNGPATSVKTNKKNGVTKMGY